MKPLYAMLSHVVNIFSFQELEYERERVDLPDDYTFFKLDIVVTLLSLTHIFNLRNTLN